VTVIHEDAACSIDVGPPYTRTLKVLLSPILQNEVEGFASGYTILPPGSESDYTNHSEGEMFCVIEGSGEIRKNEDRHRLKPGSMVWCPPWDEHQLVNTGVKTLKVLWVLIPPGREGGIIEQSRKKEHEG
jgi:quercetin dioxygenase-like cupin family protein